VLSFFSLEYLNHRNQVIFALQYIATLLKRFHWIKDFQLLDKAKVPLLTFVKNMKCRVQTRVFTLSWGHRRRQSSKLTTKKLIPRKQLFKLTLQFNLSPIPPKCQTADWSQLNPSRHGWMFFLLCKRRSFSWNCYCGRLSSTKLMMEELVLTPYHSWW